MDMSHNDHDDRSFTYVSPPRPGSAPGGTWSVLYKGVARTFSLPPLSNSSFVVIFPTVTVDGNGFLTQVDWEYRDRFGVRLPTIPTFIAGVRVHAHVANGGDDEPESPSLPPATTTYTFPGVRPVWAEVKMLAFDYSDLAGNEFQLHYGKPFSVMAETRLENTYGEGRPPQGSQERLLHIFVDVPFNSVDRTPCFVQEQQGPSRFVSVVNNGAEGPFASPTCVDWTGTTQFDEDFTLTDIFSRREPLSGPALNQGTEFLISVRPVDTLIPTQNVTATLRNPEARVPDDFILIPNPSTPNLVPTGTELADARLGQNQTISWTLPTFSVKEVRLSPIVMLTPFGGGAFCSVPQQFLSPTTTQATFKFPTTCFTQPVMSAQVCVFFLGDNGESSTGCWFFQDPN